MKPTAVIAASTLVMLLAACDSSPKVDVKDANMSEVREAVAQSGIAKDDSFQVNPGKWESRVTVEAIEIPGMPDNMREQMKKSFAEHQATAFTSCLTPEQAKKPKEDFFAGKDNKCRYDHFTMGGGKIDAKMRCEGGGGSTQIMEMAGSYAPESYTMTVSTSREGGIGPGGDAKMKMRMDAKRIGECDPKTA